MDAPANSGRPALLGQLLSETTTYCKTHWKSLLLGAVIFGVLMGIASIALGVQASREVQMGLGQMGIDLEQMEQLGERMEAGDEAALAELEALMRDRFDGMSDDQIAREMMGPSMAMIGRMLPAIGLGVVINFLLMFFAHAYYALVAVEGQDMGNTMKRAKKELLPLTGVSIWSFLRTFAWIPVIGIIPAVILGPRFIAAPLIYLTEGKGVTASVSESYRRTQGYWSKIVGNMIVAILIMIVASIVLGMIAGIAFIMLPGAVAVANQVISQALFACMTVFVVRLSRTILQHPIAIAS